MIDLDDGRIMTEASINAVRPEDANHNAAVVMVHGYTGSGPGTWTDLAPRVAGDAQLSSWDGWTMTYATSWRPDISGIWSADASLSILAERLATDLGRGTLARYKSLVLMAHSMGGLIVQRTLLDFKPIAARTNTVILFGTPSNGLVKANTMKFWKRQLNDMAKGGPFVKQLRADWTKQFETKAPFSFLAVGGEQDQFVPPESSIEPFPKDQRAVIVGNHVTMIHPPKSDPNVVDLVVRRIIRKRGSGDIGDSALRAIELGDFLSIIPDDLEDAKKLDSKALVRLAIALDSVDRRDDAYKVLADRDDLNSDVLGTMAGRLKRKWLLSGRHRADAEAAMAHYAKGYDLAREANDWRQAYYHGINLAFLALVFQGHRSDARKRAQEVLDICRQCEVAGDADEWVEATRGEAELILGNDDAAFEAYRRFVAAGNDPWKLSSTYLNARTIAAEFGKRELARRLGQIFGDPNP
jgi:predicted alpha/beta hydrolase family esterase